MTYGDLSGLATDSVLDVDTLRERLRKMSGKTVRSFAPRDRTSGSRRERFGPFGSCMGNNDKVERHLRGGTDANFFTGALDRGFGSTSNDSSGAIQSANCRSIVRLSRDHQEGRTGRRIN